MDVPWMVLVCCTLLAVRWLVASAMIAAAKADKAHRWHMEPEHERWREPLNHHRY